MANSDNSDKKPEDKGAKTVGAGPSIAAHTKDGKSRGPIGQNEKAEKTEKP